MLALTSSPFSLFSQLDRQLQHAELSPTAEVREDDHRYQLAIDLPGIANDAIDLKATESGLSITAERPEPRFGEERVVSEVRYGRWSRSFLFGKRINPDELQAEMRDGVLTVTAPKVDPVKAVTVKVAS